MDYSDGEPTVTKFAIRLSNAEEAQNLKRAFDEAKEENGKLQSEEESKEE